MKYSHATRVKIGEDLTLTRRFFRNSGWFYSTDLTRNKKYRVVDTDVYESFLSIGPEIVFTIIGDIGRKYRIDHRGFRSPY